MLPILTLPSSIALPGTFSVEPRLTTVRVCWPSLQVPSFFPPPSGSMPARSHGVSPGGSFTSSAGFPSVSNTLSTRRKAAASSGSDEVASTSTLSYTLCSPRPPLRRMALSVDSFHVTETRKLP